MPSADDGLTQRSTIELPVLDVIRQGIHDFRVIESGVRLVHQRRSGGVITQVGCTWACDMYIAPEMYPYDLDC